MAEGWHVLQLRRRLPAAWDPGQLVETLAVRCSDLRHHLHHHQRHCPPPPRCVLPENDDRCAAHRGGGSSSHGHALSRVLPPLSASLHAPPLRLVRLGRPLPAQLLALRPCPRDIREPRDLSNREGPVHAGFACLQPAQCHGQLKDFFAHALFPGSRQALHPLLSQLDHGNAGLAARDVCDAGESRWKLHGRGTDGSVEVTTARPQGMDAGRLCKLPAFQGLRLVPGALDSPRVSHFLVPRLRRLGLPDDHRRSGRSLVLQGRRGRGGRQGQGAPSAQVAAALCLLPPRDSSVRLPPPRPPVDDAVLDGEQPEEAEAAALASARCRPRLHRPVLLVVHGEARQVPQPERAHHRRHTWRELLLVCQESHVAPHGKHPAHGGS
mmetsp:Transcript_21183/g.47758  ORF Transcript_21183/g.47758 Transcript_21183/m.47758 type:complete len:381 (+) Transcript_21183:1326-2468(+)|eukprot:753820-Hanusia_phi.AAC.4